MADRIELKGLKVVANHGALPHEAEVAQPFSIDIVCWLDFDDATANDDLERTVNYAELAEMASFIASGTPRKLIETVASEIADSAMRTYGFLHAVEVTVHKPHAPIPQLFDDIAVVARRSRKNFKG